MSRIHTRIEVEWSDEQQAYILLAESGFDYEGKVALCKGASTSQENLANSQANFYNTLTSDYGTTFGESQGIVKGLTDALQPIIAAGPSQNGYSAGETNDLNSEAIQGTGQQYASAEKALNEQQASEGGGNSFLPSGVKSQEDAELAATGANQTSSELLGVKQAGYNQGYQTYENALGQLEGTANLVNPNASAATATATGTGAFNDATQVQQMNNAASPLGVIGGILGGAASSFLNPAAAILGKSVGGAATAPSIAPTSSSNFPIAAGPTLQLPNLGL